MTNAILKSLKQARLSCTYIFSTKHSKRHSLSALTATSVRRFLFMNKFRCFLCIILFLAKQKK